MAAAAGKVRYWLRYAKALDMRLGGAKLHEIAEHLGVSTERARQMVRTAKWRLAHRVFYGVPFRSQTVRKQYATVPLCDRCWHVFQYQDPNARPREPVRLRQAHEEQCHFCQGKTISGIYVRWEIT